MKIKLLKASSSLQTRRISPLSIILLSFLAICFTYICYLNLSLSPSFYDSDMYTDILFASKAWENKSLFPEGWVFGNQLYIIATPALASLVCGIVDNPALAMAIATIFMTIGIFFSYLWMITPVFPKLEDKLLGLVCFVVITAFCGDSIYSHTGWQLFFTLCSYYACYLITAFICFGCFLRRNENPTTSTKILLGIAVILSFCSGMQSLRQTALMLMPMLVVEGIAQLVNFIRTKKVNLHAIIVTSSLSAANLLGLAAIKLLNIPQNKIFSIDFLELSEIPKAIIESITNVLDLITHEKFYGMLIMLTAVIVIISIIQTKFRKESPSAGWKTLITLFSISILVIWVVDIFTNMPVRSIYYFMILPTIATLFVYAFHTWRLGKFFTLTFLTLLIAISFKKVILPATTIEKPDTDKHYQISQMLTEKGYTTIYLPWNNGEGIAIASGGDLTAGFWHGSEDIFCPIMYLCDPSVYKADNTKSVYFILEEDKQLALETADSVGVTLTLVAEYPQWGILLYEASDNLMVIFSES